MTFICGTKPVSLSALNMALSISRWLPPDRPLQPGAMATAHHLHPRGPHRLFLVLIGNRIAVIIRVYCQLFYQVGCSARNRRRQRPMESSPSSGATVFSAVLRFLYVIDLNGISDLGFNLRVSTKNQVMFGLRASDVQGRR